MKTLTILTALIAIAALCGNLAQQEFEQDLDRKLAEEAALWRHLTD